MNFLATVKRIPDDVYASWDRSEPINATSDIDISQGSDSDDQVDSESWDHDIVAAASTGASVTSSTSVIITDNSSRVAQCGQKRRLVSLSTAETPDEPRHSKKAKFGECICHSLFRPKA